MKTKTIHNHHKDGGSKQCEESGNELLAFFALLHKIKKRNKKEAVCRDENQMTEVKKP